MSFADSGPLSCKQLNYSRFNLTLSVHLGLFNLLRQLKEIKSVDPEQKPVPVMGPATLYKRLSLYSSCIQDFNGSYDFICNDQLVRIQIANYLRWLLNALRYVITDGREANKAQTSITIRHRTERHCDLLRETYFRLIWYIVVDVSTT